ncbi:MAG: FkbM family methyltransferase [Flavisolibacter sp.]
MAVSGITRYQRLKKNIANWGEYLFHKGERKKRPLEFITRPQPIHFSVPSSLYQVFKEIFMEDFYEIDSLVQKLPQEPVVIDVGANAGFFNVLLFSKIPRAKVFAYEPMPSNIRFFRETMERNPLLRQVRLYQAAVTGSPRDFVELFTEDTPDNTVVSSVFSHFNQLNNKKIKVAATSLTAILKEENLPVVDLLKLDCEGSEYDILYNTDPLELQRIRMMVIEVHQLDRERHNVEALDQYLKDIGYTNRILPVQEGSYYLMATKN